jgi:hypothetical protein
LLEYYLTKSPPSDLYKMTRFTHTPSFSHLLWPPTRDVGSIAAREESKNSSTVWAIIAVGLIIVLPLLGGGVVKRYQHVKKKRARRADVEQGTTSA